MSIRKVFAKHADGTPALYLEELKDMTGHNVLLLSDDNVSVPVETEEEIEQLVQAWRDKCRV